MLKPIGNLWFKASGWTLKGQVPENLRSFILLGAPHTSNLDFVPAMALATYLGKRAKFVIKNDWLKFPMNLIMKPAGAIGLDREKIKQEGGANTTDMMADLFKKYDELVLMITPEGTRSPTNHWKTGFYYIAQKARVPIVLAYADFEKKVAGIGPIIYPTDFTKDFQTILEFYKNIRGRHPEKFLLDSRYLPVE